MSCEARRKRCPAAGVAAGIRPEKDEAACPYSSNEEQAAQTDLGTAGVAGTQRMEGK
jgi:hypothetical protein